jgi:LPS export ABC transporter protein LptC
MLNRRNLLWLLPLLLVATFPVWRIPLSSFLEPRGGDAPGSNRDPEDLHNFVMDQVVIMQNKAGKKTAKIRAGQAFTSEKSNEFVLTVVNADLYGEDEEELNILAQTGIYNTETRQLTLEGNVRVTRIATNQRLFSELLYYYDKKRVFESPVATRILADQIELKGSSLVYDIPTGQYEVGGRVYGTITGFNNP